MLKNIIIALFGFFFCLNSYSQSISDILNLSPQECADYLDPVPTNFAYNSDLMYWITSSGQQIHIIHKYFKDIDGDGFIDPNSYIAIIRNGYNDNPTYFSFNTQNKSLTVLDPSNSTTVDIDYVEYSVSYNGYTWIRPSGLNGLFLNMVDCDDTNSNLPSSTQPPIERRYLDSDQDGFGDKFIFKYFTVGCSQTTGYVTNSNDCNDNDSNVTTQAINWFRDFDGDGYGDANDVVSSCGQPEGYVLNDDDCMDFNSAYNVEQIVWYADFDQDGFGDPNDTIVASCPPQNYVTDCYFDDCPTQAGTRTNGCPLVSYNFDNDNRNYVYEKVYKDSYEPEQLASAPSTSVIQQITYTDGFGRLKQQNSLGNTPLGNDIVTQYDYDGNGESNKSFLPYVSSTTGGLYDSSGTANTLAYYNTASFDYTTNPYSETSKEQSPLNRILEQGAPGSDWALDKLSDTDHTLKFEYDVNIIDEVAFYQVIFPTGNITSPQLFYNGSYAAGELSKTIIKDENWSPTQTQEHTTEEFKDKQGRLVLKRTFNSSSHDTYYVYDDFGNLTYVLSPKGSDLVLFQNTYSSSSMVENVIELIPEDINGNPITTGTGNTTSTVDATTKQITINFNVTFNTPINILNGSTFKVQTGVPNMMIGNITTSGVDYTISIQEGYLNIIGDGLVSSINETFTVDLPEYSIQQQIIDGLGYEYKYDQRNRLIEKKVSGKNWEYIVYDKFDRPVLTQDANLKATDHWLFTKYDDFGRVAYTGKMLIQGEDRTSLQTLTEAQVVLNESSTTTATYVQGWPIYYTNQALDFSNISANIVELYIVNYYDTYNNELSTAVPNPNTVFGTAVTSNTKMLPTGSKVYVLNKSEWITSVSYYDEKGRAIYTGSKNEYLNTTDIIKMDLDDFTGQVLKTESTHTKGTNTPIVVTNDFSYDHVHRLKTQIQTITGEAPELIVSNTYNEIGQLITKDVGNTIASPLQNVDYTYNIRGWVKEINDHTNLGNDLFGYKINYNDPDSNSTPLYNGNISQVEWHTGNPNNPTNYPIPFRYDYSYDALNRLSNAIDDTGAYSEEPLYDKNGNITRMHRYARRNKWSKAQIYEMDYLIYLYNDNSNQLRTVYDKGWRTSGFIDSSENLLTDYTYDDNGNLVQDLNKGISSTTYNHLNLPKQATFSNGNIQYVYDALGIKLEKVITEGSSVTKTKYAGNYLYREDSLGESLEFFNHSEGYVDASGTGYKYVYQYKDQVGNIRLSYKDANGNYEEVLDSDFESSFDGWEENGSVNYSLDSGRLKANVNSSWEGVRHPLTGLTTVAGETITVKVNFDKGNTQSSVRLYLPEYNSSGTFVRYNVLNSNLQTGYSEHTLTFVDSGNSLDYIRIDKDNTNTSTETYFYIDHVSLTQNSLEIQEENNYYPFGLKHNSGLDTNLGYNGVINGMDHRYGFNGVEETDDLNFKMLDMDLRQYDPSIARWISIDPVTHFSASTYTAFDNNPIYWSDPSGADSEGYFGKYDLEWGGYMMDRGDPNFSDEGQSYGLFSYQWDEGTMLNEVVVTADLSVIKLWDSFFSFYNTVQEIEKGAQDGGIQRIEDAADFVMNFDKRPYWQEKVDRVKSNFNNFAEGFVNSGSGDLLAYSATLAYQGVSSMTAYDWGYLGGYSAPDLAISFGGTYVLSGLRISLTGLRASNMGLRYHMGSFIYKTARLDSRLTARTFPGVGQRDVAHIAATFFRKEILTEGKIQIQGYNNIRFYHTIGNRKFDIAFNPWSWKIFHEGPY